MEETKTFLVFYLNRENLTNYYATNRAIFNPSSLIKFRHTIIPDHIAVRLFNA